MFGVPSRFPDIQHWTRMSEDEQDALLTHMEAVRQRRARLVSVAVLIGLAAVAYAGLATWF